MEKGYYIQLDYITKCCKTSLTKMNTPVAISIVRDDCVVSVNMATFYLPIELSQLYIHFVEWCHRVHIYCLSPPYYLLCCDIISYQCQFSYYECTSTPLSNILPAVVPWGNYVQKKRVLQLRNEHWWCKCCQGNLFGFHLKQCMSMSCVVGCTFASELACLC